MSLTQRLRDELARVEVTRRCCLRAQTAAVVRLAGAVEMRGGTAERLGVAVSTSSAAVARALLSALRDLGGVDTQVEAHRPGTLRRAATYRVRCQGAEVLAELGVIDEDGRPRQRAPGHLTADRCDATAYVRGALMATGRCSDPLKEPHLELGASSEEAARHLEALARTAGAPGARATGQGDRWRVIVKSGEQIGALLARTGAHDAFLTWDEGRLRRELRGQANRVANADRANLSRAVRAASRQVDSIERLLGSDDFSSLDEELRQTALARLANPEASLAELGALLDPPVGKGAVHRRLERLLAAAEETAEG